MLWNKAWLETRWQFVIGLAIVICSAVGVVLVWPRVMQLLPLASQMEAGGVIGRQIREAAEVQSTYRGYVWSNWFSQNLTNLGTVLAALLGTGGLLSRRSGGRYMLSLPILRSQLIVTRAAAGLAELLVLVLAPSLLIPLLSPAIGRAYGIGEALIHGLCLFVAAATFFSLSLWLSTVFSDFWRPMLISLSVAIVLGSFESPMIGLLPSGIFHVMSAESYFRRGELPWSGLAASAVASTAMLYGAAIQIARQDF